MESYCGSCTQVSAGSLGRLHGGYQRCCVSGARVHKGGAVLWYTGALVLVRTDCGYGVERWVECTQQCSRNASGKYRTLVQYALYQHLGVLLVACSDNLIYGQFLCGVPKLLELSHLAFATCAHGAAVARKGGKGILAIVENTENHCAAPPMLFLPCGQLGRA